MREISKLRFDALAGYTRSPHMMLITQEAAWFEVGDERLLGVIVWDRFDHDYGWVILGRDQRGRFRAIMQDASLPSFGAACAALDRSMEIHLPQPDEAYHQGDEIGRPIDFFGPHARPERRHPSFMTLIGERRFSPARELIAAMMPFYEDADGNFVEQFQTAGFDARFWELYLYAAFVELGYAPRTDVAVPDLLLEGPLGRLAIEATTSNPPQGRVMEVPREEDALRLYLEDYVPMKLGRALKAKLYHKNRYWQAPGVDDAPFVIALQDFHAPAAMVGIVPAATEYVFGVRHSIVAGERRIEWIDEHVHEGVQEPSGFFRLPESENVSAVFVNPLGTLTKFNRLGYLAGFGDRGVRMVRSGIARGEQDADDPRPWRFHQDVGDRDYRETWIEGAVVLHNPNARIPLDPDQIPGAAHEFMRSDGALFSMLPDFQPYMSRTSVALAGDEQTYDDIAPGEPEAGS